VLNLDEERRIESLLDAMTLEEKASLTGGGDVWHLPAIERLGIGSLKMSDGPSGVRGQHFGLRRSLSFPCGMAVGATWNVELTSRYGRVLSEEAVAKGVHVLLGPTVGIPRTPLGGRVFESFAEDPKLTAALAVAYIRGVQDGGVACCVKHFACNDQEFERMTISAEVDERTLREIHLPAFEAAVRDGGVLSVMSAYNRLGGVYCGEHGELLGSILKGEWDFDGAVISDWLGTHSTVAAAVAGLDVEMPGPPRFFGQRLAEAVDAGELDVTMLDEKVRRILRIASHTGILDASTRTDEPQDPDTPSRRALARELCVEATVLLANDGLLPLDPTIRSIAVIGPSADHLVTGGGGSSEVLAHRTGSLLKELGARFPEATIVHEAGCAPGDEIDPIDPTLLGEGMRLEYYNGEFNADVAHRDTLLLGRFITLGDPAPGVSFKDFSLRATGVLSPDTSGPWQLAMSATGPTRVLLDGNALLDNAAAGPGESFYGLGTAAQNVTVDLEVGHSYELVVELRSTGLPIAGFELGARPPRRADLLERAVHAAANADVAIVVVGSSRTSETEGADRTDLRLIGAQDELVGRIVDANPRTVVVLNVGAPVQTPWASRAAAILNCWYPGEEGAGALAQILSGEEDPGGRLPITFPKAIEDTPTFGEWYPGTNGKVTYGEGVFVGYRHYDSRGVEPQFAFGHGLSYSSFEYSVPIIEIVSGVVRARVAITNAGDRRAREVVQVYVRALDPVIECPDKELKAFEKVHLEAGATIDVSFELSARDFCYWDEAAHDWKVVGHDFELLFASSSRDVRQSATVTLHR
jgi:beta-glucosidase